ncbi:MFS transporter [Alicyclobacillus fastidiosus]|uniref:MFS transporter n=1 Tax=Alicyclobacillus fastidiosus TaxID=392011 RepID=A0ABY6ZHC5_9BACL|nr:MFS transporter [Alicyclobacillus fastidiosus]WAH41616.1 MFS transporter [Alicyclobacillus fastidiosus]GMA63281.1 MFS transporter [Alicyclobacillus fastidiosus]
MGSSPQVESSITLTKKIGRTRWLYILPVLTSLWAVGSIEKTNVGIISAYKPFLSDMGLSNAPGKIGLLTTLFLVTYGIGMVVWGFVIDRWGPRKTAITAVSIWIVATLLAGASTDPVTLYISRLLLGLGEGALWPICTKMTSNWFRRDEESRATSIWVNGMNVGIAFGGIIITSIIGSIGWHSVFFILAAVALIPLGLIISLVRDHPADSAFIDEPERIFIDQGKALGTPKSTGGLRNYRLWLLLVANVATGMGFWGVNSWVPKYLVDVRHLSMSGMGIFTLVAWLLCAVVLMIFGAWADKVNRRAPFAVCGYIVYAVVLWGCTAVSSTLLAMLLLAVAIWTLQTTTLMVFSLVHGVSKQSNVGSQTGVMSGLSNIVAAFAPFIMGVIIGANSDYTGAFVFLSAAGVIGAIMVAILIPQRF